MKDASHGDWYYNGDEFGGIFKGQFDILKALKKKIFFYLLIELWIGKIVTSNDPEENDIYDEVRLVIWALYFLVHAYFQQFRLKVDDSKEFTTAIWAHHLTREGFTKKKKPKYQWLSYGIRNGRTQTQVNKSFDQWKDLSLTEKAALDEKLKPLKWLLQKWVNFIENW